jgi:DNA-binding LacI/PurR family transcriptional regulator
MKGCFMATIKDIARESGVSVATVSRYINGNAHIGNANSERIAEVISRLGYRPSRTARSLKTHNSRNIMLVVPDINNPFYSKMAEVVNQRCRAKGYTMTLYNTSEEIHEELQAIRLAGDIFADGIVFASVTAQELVLEELKQSRCQIVLVNSYDGCPVDTVHGDRVREGTYLSTKYLIENGHTRIGFAGGLSGTAVAENRKRGYCRALAEAGIEADDELIFEMGFNLESGKKAGRYFTALDPRPSAICCANDMIALGVISVFGEMGIKIPNDFSVTGMDDVPYSLRSFASLTTVTNDSAEFANDAMDALFDRISGKYAGAPRESVIDRELIIRTSVKNLVK